MIVINAARIFDEVCKDLADCQRSGSRLPVSMSVNWETYKALRLASAPTFEQFKEPQTFLGRTIELNEHLADGAYELK